MGCTTSRLKFFLNMKIFIFGATGLVGNYLFSFLKEKGHEVSGSSTRDIDNFSQFNFLESKNNSFIKSVVESFDLIINAVVINSKKVELYDYFDVIRVNSLFPQLLNWFTKSHNKKLINISTDAIFSGNFNDEVITEENLKDGTDKYSISKILSELDSPNSINIRSSFLGYDKNIPSGLIYNLHKLKNGEVNVHDKYWHGCTNDQFSQFIEEVVCHPDKFNNLFKFKNFNFFPNPPLKNYNLFKLINSVFALNLKLISSDNSQPSKVFSSDVDSLEFNVSDNLEDSLKKIRGK
jgi:dTDP-4-dehydrorhamnose reductase